MEDKPVEEKRSLKTVIETTVSLVGQIGNILYGAGKEAPEETETTTAGTINLAIKEIDRINKRLENILREISLLK